MQVTFVAVVFVCRKVSSLRFHAPFLVVQSAVFSSFPWNVVSVAVTLSPVKVALVAQVPRPMLPLLAFCAGLLSRSVQRMFCLPTLLLNMRCT